MIDKKLIEKNLKNTLSSTNLRDIGQKITGKVRDVYVKEGKIILISTDRQSAFDRNLAQVPFKGQVLTQTSAWWFEQVADIVPHHVISVPDPNVVIGKKLSIFPIEFVVRGYLTGTTSTSAWTAYAKGEREFCGHILPENMVKNQPFEKPLLTPTTKDDLHDEKISEKEILDQMIMTPEDWNYCAEKSLAVFKRGQEIAKKNGLILVDTKYEFGKDENGKIYLCDEIHTPDSSRYWLLDSYAENLAAGKEPRNIDKEFLRLWFKDNCDPYNDKVLPQAPDELIIELAGRYIELYERITGREFQYNTEAIESRIEKNLRTAL